MRHSDVKYVDPSNLTFDIVTLHVFHNLILFAKYDAATVMTHEAFCALAL